MESDIRETKLNNVSKKFGKLFNTNLLPHNIMISTTTITCGLKTTFNLINVAKYIDIKEGGILRIKCGPEYVREIKSKEPVKKRKKRKSSAVVRKNRKKTKSKHFYNQATLVVCPLNGPTINIKIFANGSFHLTGCKNIKHCFDGLYTLFEYLKVRKAIINPTTLNSIIEKPFVEDIDILDIEMVNLFNVNMINSNFSLGFKVNRNELFGILIDEDIECSYEPLVHASVDIKYEYKEEGKDKRKVSIFVFEKGSVIITGARSCKEILSAYKFIIGIIHNHYKEIYKINIRGIMDKMLAQEIVVEEKKVK